jgi:CRP/FNR family transcriptional regulator
MKPSKGVGIEENCCVCRWRKGRDAFSLCNLSGETLQRLQQITALRVHDAGSVLYREEQVPTGIFILCNGRAKISISSRRGSVVILKVAEAGEALGLEAFFANKPHEETAVLLDSCQVKFIPAEELRTFLVQHGEASLRAAHQLGTNCRSARQQIRRIGLSVSGRERLVRLLITWANPERRKQAQETIVSAPFTHQEIAQMVGSSRETITRALNSLKRKDVLEIRNRTLIVKNVDELERLADQ